MPPSPGSRCTVMVDGYRYEAVITDADVVAERQEVMGSRGRVIGFTSGQVTQTLTLTLTSGPSLDQEEIERRNLSTSAASQLADVLEQAAGLALAPVEGREATYRIVNGQPFPSVAPTWSDQVVGINESGDSVTVTQPELETDEELRARIRDRWSLALAAGSDLDTMADMYGLERQLRDPQEAGAPKHASTLTLKQLPPKTRYEMIREEAL